MDLVYVMVATYQLLHTEGSMGLLVIECKQPAAADEICSIAGK